MERENRLDHEKFKQARNEAGLSLSEAARALGFQTPTGYWHIEKGRRSVTATQLYLFSQITGWSMESFFS